MFDPVQIVLSTWPLSSLAEQVAKLEEEVNEKSQKLQQLEEKLKSQEDYEEIKRELRWDIESKISRCYTG